MKTGKTLTELAVELDRQVKSKRDFVASTQQLVLQESEALGGHNLFVRGPIDEAFPIREIAHDQLATHCEIPKKYYEKLQTNAPNLLCQNVNHWLQKGTDKRLIRTLDGYARAFLSDKYRPLDNYDLAEIALPELTKAGCRVESCEVTDRRMYIKAVTERLSYDLKKGDTVQAGIVISNSEVGQGSLSVEPLLFRLVCLNGMIVNDARMRKTHVGRGSGGFDGAMEYFRDETRKQDDKVFWMKVRDTIAAAFNEIAFGSFVDKFRVSQNDRIERDIVDAVEITQKRFALSDGERSNVLTHLIQGGDLNRFGLINAITRTAQDIESYDRSTELERLGGTILELPRSDWNTIALAA